MSEFTLCSACDNYQYCHDKILEPERKMAEILESLGATAFYFQFFIKACNNYKEKEIKWGTLHVERRVEG